MAEKLKEGRSQALRIGVSHSSDVSVARRKAKKMATEVGFDEKATEEVAIVVSELASNLVKYAKLGFLSLTPIEVGGLAGLQIESQDSGPGIPDIEAAIGDGTSTGGSLGAGLGAVNRLMDEFDISSQHSGGGGTHIMCRRWVRPEKPRVTPCPLSFGAAARAHPKMDVNGDAFVIKQWSNSALVGVIDGVGHGQFAHRAAKTARQYVESHFDQPLAAMFRGVQRACRSTRGVVMALARFEWERARLTFASVGNIEVRVFGNSQPMNFMIRRGLIGFNAPDPVVTEHHWEPGYVMVLHSDGLKTLWRWEDFPGFAGASATLTAQRLLRGLARDNDDATVVVVKGTN